MEGIKYTKRIGAYVIIEREEDNKIGIATTIEGDYFFLGGGLENEETEEEALKRELLEESGYSIKNVKYFDKVTAWADGGSRGPLDVTATFYIAEFDKKIVEPTEKDHKVIWVDANEYKDKLYHEYQRYILNKYIENKQSHNSTKKTIQNKTVPLILKNVSKTFADKKVVDNISFKLEKPGVFGLLGTNGAGKTTTIRMILGIIKKGSGEVTWNGNAVDRKNVNFGYLPEERGVYPKVKIEDQLMYFAKLKGMETKEAKDSIQKWAKKLKVEEYLGMQAEKLSKGNQQKIQFMTAVIHDPELIVLDEPFSGLDPVNTEILKNIIIELVSNGKYIIMSAHQMATIEEFCTDILILNKGKTVLQGNLKEIKETYPANRVEIDTNQDISSFIEKFNLSIENEKDNQYVIKITEEEKAHELLTELVKNKIQINKFEIKKPTLNDIFIEKVGE